MGMKLFGTSSSRSESSGIRLGSGGEAGSPLPGDPNPARFEFLRLEHIGAFCVAEVLYPDAKNFDGKKIAVYRATPEELWRTSRLDPHFQEKRGPLVPIARFEPTPEGWEMAVWLAKKLGER